MSAIRRKIIVIVIGIVKVKAPFNILEGSLQYPI
jgi:hypothetical protein